MSVFVAANAIRNGAGAGNTQLSNYGTWREDEAAAPLAKVNYNCMGRTVTCTVMTKEEYVKTCVVALFMLCGAAITGTAGFLSKDTMSLAAKAAFFSLDAACVFAALILLSIATIFYTCVRRLEPVAV